MSVLNFLNLSTQDDQLVQVLATFLVARGIPETSSYPVALTVLWALEHYNQRADVERFAQRLGLDLKLLTPHQNKACPQGQ